MPFGQKVGTIKNLKAGLKKGSTEGFITWIPKDKPLNIRFLTEPDNWVQFRSTFDPMKRKGYPVPDPGMPGYPDADQRQSTAYLANAVDVDTDKVIAIQLPKSLVNSLVVRYERYETLTDRDYELFRSGEGMDTEYGLTPESPTKRNVAKYSIKDLSQVLEAAYKDVWGDGDDHADNEDAVRTSKPSSDVGATKKRSVVVEDADDDTDDVDDDVEDDLDDDDDEDSVEDDDEDSENDSELIDLDELAQLADDDDDEDAQLVLTERADSAGIDPDIFDTWEDVAEAIKSAKNDDDDDDDEVSWNRDDLEAKTLGEVRAIARDKPFNINTKGMGKLQTIDAILSS